MVTWFQEVPAWLSVLIALAGAAICGSNIGRTRWAMLLLGGFFAEAIAMAFSRLAVLGVQMGMATVGSIGAAMLVASLIGLAGRGALVAGVAGLLSDIRRGSNLSGA